MTDTLDYVAAAIIDRMVVPSTTEIGSLKDIQAVFDASYGRLVVDEHADIVARRLEQLGFLKRVSDLYAGTYFVPLSSLRSALRINEVRSSLPNTTIVQALDGGLALFKRVFANENFWSDFKEELEPATPDAIIDALENEIPASDRIVTLSHNQQAELDNLSTDVINEFSKENSFDGDSNLKERMLGQLRAARELIRSQVFRAYLLYEMTIDVLGALISKYGGKLLGEVSKKLLDKLLDQVLGK